MVKSPCLPLSIQLGAAVFEGGDAPARVSLSVLIRGRDVLLGVAGLAMAGALVWRKGGKRLAPP
jgi:hypothetical protein